MIRYIALLRGVNVGGNNKLAMPALKAAFERQGFQNVITYINSGNIIFDSDLTESDVKSACEDLIEASFGLKIAVGIITADELSDALAHAPAWWDADAESKHNAIFVIPPATVQDVCAQIGDIKPEYEKIFYFNKIIFWSAPVATFSRTRLTTIVKDKTVYNAVTIRNANTAKKLAELASGKGK